MCDSAWAVVSAAFLGTVTGIGTVVLSHWLSNRWSDRQEDARRRLLTDMLSKSPLAWRKLSTLSHVIGADEELTKRLLIQIGARADENGKPMWALISRVDLPAKE